MRVAQLKDDLEKKDEVIMELKEQNNKLEVCELWVCHIIM